MVHHKVHKWLRPGDLEMYNVDIGIDRLRLRFGVRRLIVVGEEVEVVGGVVRRRRRVVVVVVVVACRSLDRVGEGIDGLGNRDLKMCNRRISSYFEGVLGLVWLRRGIY
jgi:hypothetical protein